MWQHRSVKNIVVIVRRKDILLGLARSWGRGGSDTKHCNRLCFPDCGEFCPVCCCPEPKSPDCQGEEVKTTLVVRSSILGRSEEHTSELQSLRHLVCRL